MDRFAAIAAISSAARRAASISPPAAARVMWVSVSDAAAVLWSVGFGAQEELSQR
jgi:hypothetical protein